jgi:AcrR family transcriptional regulator
MTGLQQVERVMTEKTSYHHGDLKNALIKAGIEILDKRGTEALSLRRVARWAGVSHTAPYAHFTDKQALVAAISTEGYKKLYEKMSVAIQTHHGDPRQQLIAASWAYIEFALDNTAHFKLTLSGIVEKEKDYPEFVEITMKNFDLVVQLVKTCQQVGVLREGPPKLVAITVWSQVHGFISLFLEGQISHDLIKTHTLKKMWLFSLNQLTLTNIETVL